MKLRLRNIFFCCILLVLSARLVSCSDSEPELKATETVVNFSVVTPKQIETRSATPPTPAPDDTDKWGDNYISADSTELDNKLLEDGFTVVFTDQECKVLSKITTFIRSVTPTPSGGTLYAFTGIIPSEKVADLKKYRDAKIHVIANAGNPETLKENLSFEKSGQEIDAIPMWGVHTVNLTTLQQGSTYDAGTIELLRAMAKVEIGIAPDDDDTAPNLITGLVSATVNGANSQGYVLPNAWKSAGETTAIRFDETIRAYASLSDADNTMKPDGNNKITFYLPETENNDGQVNITLTYEVNGGDEGMILGEDRTGYIQFAVYNNDGEVTETRNHIVRNHLYRFMVKLSSEETNMEIRYTVCPMKELETDIPEFN